METLRHGRAPRARHALVLLSLQPHVRRLRRHHQLSDDLSSTSSITLSRVTAGDFTTVVVVSGSLMRPLGGWLSDRIGGYRSLLLASRLPLRLALELVAGLFSLAVVVPMLFVTVGCLGMGNGAVFQLVPQRFASRMGIITGVVGAAGGLGGFFLPSILGAAKDATGSYATGLTLFAVAFAVGAVVLLELGSRWSSTWQEGAVKQSGISAIESTRHL